MSVAELIEELRHGPDHLRPLLEELADWVEEITTNNAERQSA